MRWKFSGCTAALVIVGFVASTGTAAAKSRSRAKAKAAKAAKAAVVVPEKKKAAELQTDDRAITKQMQWEDKVMGPNDKKAELAKIARAAAITRAAAEKAAADKAAGLDVKEAAPAARPQAKAALNLPTLPDEGDGKASKRDDGKRREISAKLLTEEPSPPPPPTKPADDKFIDKLLHSDGPTKKKVAKANDSELDQLLAKESDKPAVKTKARGKTDVVDSLLASAEKEAEKPVSKPKQPDWTKPEPPIAPPPPAPVAVKPAPRKDNGVIQVIQGANYAPLPPVAAAPPPVPSPSRRLTAPAEPPAAPAPRTVAAKPSNWKDPFSDSNAGTRKQTAAAATPPLGKKETGTSAHPPGWRDPFADGPDQNKGKRAPSEPKRTNNDSQTPPPANAGQWKDPFTDKGGGARATVAVAEISKPEQRKWDVAARRTKASPPIPGDSPSGWGVLKKRAQ